MDDTNRYSVPENEDYEPGSNNEVLKNLMGVKIKTLSSKLKKRN